MALRLCDSSRCADAQRLLGQTSIALARREIGLTRRLDSAAAIKSVDLSLPVGCLTDRAVRLVRLHAQPRDGPMVSGAAAFVAMWRVIPRLRPLAALASPPPSSRSWNAPTLSF